jgi:hypothetical protein
MDPKNSGIALSVLSGTFVGCIFSIGGYYLSVDGEHQAYGLVMFMLVPFVAGLAIGAIARRGTYAIASIILTAIFTMAWLVIVGSEGYICVLMALPLWALGMIFGAVVGYFVRGRFLDLHEKGNHTKLLFLAGFPFLMVAASEAERPWRRAQRYETFVSDVFVAASPDATWEKLVRMPRMDGAKPFLLQVGLPVPYQCTLDQDAPGGERVCHFDQGIIEMEVTEWRRPAGVDFKITESTLPGRRWLTFVDASYELVPEADGTRVIRHSTIASRLYPRWYWRQFERWGVVSEHQFVLSSLAASAAANR